MSLRSLMTLAGAATLVGCVQPVESPEELVDPTFFFFSEFETADDERAAEAVLALEAATFDVVDLDGERSGRQWQPPPLTAEHLGGATAPAGVDPELQVSVQVAGLSRHPVSVHDAGVLIPDQAPLEPSAPVHDRSFPDGTDCWETPSCERIDTINQISKSNILYTIDYDTEKDFRRLTLPDGRAVLFARTWNDEVAIGEEGINSIDQNYSTDVFVEDKDDPGKTRRIMTVWTSVTLPNTNPSDDLIRTTVALGIDSLFARHDNVWDDEAR